MAPSHLRLPRKYSFIWRKTVAVRVNTSKKAGLVQISDPEVLIPIIHQVFADNEAAVADFKSGKRNADKAFTGFLMKATKGRANPQVASSYLPKNWLS